MKSRSLWLFFILAVLTLRSLSQCSPPAGNLYDTTTVDWRKGTHVTMTFDMNGTGTGDANSGIQVIPDAGNPQPGFNLSQGTMEDFLNGAIAWNSHNSANGTNISFEEGMTFGPSNWIISTTWPKAVVKYLGADFKVHSMVVDVTGEQAAAVTVYLADFAADGSRLPVAAAALTLLNTNGSYNVPGIGNFPVFDPSQSSFGPALGALGMHESGHGFGLDDQYTVDADGKKHTVCGDVMSGWQASTTNPGGATNNNSGCNTFTITSCDENEIANSPAYNGGGGGGGDGGSGGKDCDPNLDGCTGRTGGDSPIIIDTEGEGFHLTSAKDGVSFDIRGDGKPLQIAWTDHHWSNAFLALPGPDGLVHNGKQLFGNFTAQDKSKHANGFMALAEWDEPDQGGNHDGVIDSHDAVFSKLRLWIDENHDGICQPGELHSLAEFGVHALDLGYHVSRKTDAFGNQFRYRAQVNPGRRRDFRDSREHEDHESKARTVGRWAYDVFFVTK